MRILESRKRKAYAWGEEKGSKGVIFSTGYLEPNFWSEDREYGSKGGIYGPDFPVTRDMPANSNDPSGLTGIDPLQTHGRVGVVQVMRPVPGVLMVKILEYHILEFGGLRKDI